MRISHRSKTRTINELLANFNFQFIVDKWFEVLHDFIKGNKVTIRFRYHMQFPNNVENMIRIYPVPFISYRRFSVINNDGL
jgi:hypothetical protein